MNTHIFPLRVLDSILTIIYVLISIPSSYGDNHEQYDVCSQRNPCGRDIIIWYPFWVKDIRPQYCGLKEFELECRDNQYPTIQFGDQRFRVLSMDVLRQTITIVRDTHYVLPCRPSLLKDTIINHKLFKYGPNVKIIRLFYNCSGELRPTGPNNFSCPIETGDEITGFYTIDGYPSLQNLSKSCNKVIKIPVQMIDFPLPSDDLLPGRMIEALNRGFEVEFSINNISCTRCVNSSGICGSNHSNPEQFACLCQDEPHRNTCTSNNPGSKWSVKRKIVIGICSALGGMGIMAAIFLICLHRNKIRNSSSFVFSRKTTSDPSSIEDLEKADNFLGVHVFTYAELEEATNSFDSAKELGDGGFGTVYYGKLQDGRAVAVKRLYENNYRRVEQFMNEVEILARLRHQNLVSLYGCTSRHSRELLLVYEYIPNGTVADHLHGACAKPGELHWPIRLKIAIETASALTYLHASDIIHRDVKTNNILLDNNFCVKVADFGLSRLFPNHVTHVSTAPQGTPGYVDPEYHQCYQLTDKSDVFSFGVVLIELISSMPAVDISRHRHEINLSNLAINKIQKKALHELVDSTLGYDSDYNVRKMMNAVAELAFQCLQSEKDMRPHMADVLETLKAIRNVGYNKPEEEEMDIPLEDVKPLKSGTPENSPDSEFCHSKLNHHKNRTNATN